MAEESIAYEEELYNIVVGVKNGDDEDFKALKRKYAPLIAGLVRSFDGAEDVGEYEKEAETALLKAALRYDTEQRQVAFGLYAKICIRNALISLRRKEMSKKRRMEKKAQKNLDKPRAFYSSEQNGTAETEKMVKAIRETLSPYEKKVFDEYMSDKTVEEIATELKRSRKSVHNALYRIKEKAKTLNFSPS